MELLKYGALLLEIAVTVLGVLIATQRGKSYGWFIALTFGIYVFYDLMRFLGQAANMALVLDVAFFIASLSIAWAAYRLYQGDDR